MNSFALYLTSDDKLMLAVAAGAMAGAVCAYVVGLLVDRRGKKTIAKKQEQVRLNEYSLSVATAEVVCREALVVLYDADRLLGQCAEKLQDGDWVVGLPRQVNMDHFASLEFQNEQLMAEWTALRFQLERLNHLTQEFNDHYRHIVREYNYLALRGEGGVAEVVQDNDAALHGFARRVQGVASDTIRLTKHVYALVLAHAQLNSHLQIKSVEYLNKLRVNESHYDKLRSRLDKRFNPGVLFGAPKSPPPILTSEPDPTVAPSPAKS